VKCHKDRYKAIKILNTKIPTNPCKIAIFPVGIPYSLQKPKIPTVGIFSYEWQHCYNLTAVLK